MNLLDAKKILSGEYWIDCDETTVWLVPENTKKGRYHSIRFTVRDTQFALRQLALKTEREHKKERE
jgi:hypothetical protein